MRHDALVMMVALLCHWALPTFGTAEEDSESGKKYPSTKNSCNRAFFFTVIVNFATACIFADKLPLTLSLEEATLKAVASLNYSSAAEMEKAQVIKTAFSFCTHLVTRRNVMGMQWKLHGLISVVCLSIELMLPCMHVLFHGKVDINRVISKSKKMRPFSFEIWYESVLRGPRKLP